MARAVRCVAVIGTGVIGASWAANFLARGLDVRAADPAPGAEDALRSAVAAHWPTMVRLGLAKGAAPDRLEFVATAEEAVDGADFVQENGPERLDFKRDLFRLLDGAAAPGVPIASSSSTLMVSEFQELCAEPGRVLLGHPFNPPHLIPLVEVVGGRQTDAAILERAMAFYAAMGKHPILLKREKRGHVANRLQAALWQEAVHLEAEGVASVADVDAAIAHGPGLRWALLGPFLNLHLSGGAGGMRHMLEHLGPPTESMWRDLGTMSYTPEIKSMVVAGTDEELASMDLAETVKQRDDVLVRLLQMKGAAKLP
jgi:3-hydroxyacyl-CoA dehydrogenase